jgi:hypothetical protein
MRIHRLLSFGALLLVSQLALAKLPFTNEAFGAVEGTLDFCSQADAKSASKYQERKQSLIRDVPEKELAESRRSKEYSHCYDSMKDKLEALPTEEALGACRAFLQNEK